MNTRLRLEDTARKSNRKPLYSGYMADKNRTISPLSGNRNLNNNSDENQAEITRTLTALTKLLADQSAEQMFAKAAKAKQTNKP